MKKIVLIVIIVCVAVLAAVSFAGMYKFNYLASQPGYDVDGNKIEATENETYDEADKQKNYSREDLLVSESGLEMQNLVNDFNVDLANAMKDPK